MHAFLIIGNLDSVERIAYSEKLAKKLGAKILPFYIQKIDDVKSLNNLIRLSFAEKTLIVCGNIDQATEEALNAFLKNLEEPQENIYFALTATSIASILPTIVSRCQIIKVQTTKYKVLSTDIESFLKMSTEQRIEFFDNSSSTGKIRVRSEAVEFVKSLIIYLHEKGELKNMETLLETLTRLKANGNINLQLTNLAIKYA